MPEPTAFSFDVSVPRFNRGDFTNFSLLARGREGKVKKADHTTLGCVAIKTFFHPVSLEQEGKKEISILVKSKHPNIVQLFGMLNNKHDDKKCSGYVMEFMELGSLSAIIHDSAIEYNLRQVYLWIEQVGRGLKYLHEKKIIHRDIKPQNMLLATMDHLKLADFGIARDIVDGKSNTAGHGTCFYMAPEVMRTQNYGQPADIYSVAISIWEMIHRLKPYGKCGNVLTLQNDIIGGKRPVLNPGRIDSETAMLLERGWDNDPTKRVTIVEMIEFAKQRTVNIAATCQKALQVSIAEGQSTILTATNNKMFILSEDKSHWKALSSNLSYDYRYDGLAYLNGEIYIFGGEGLKNKVYKFDHQKKWIRRADMNESRRFIGNSTVVFEGCIWVFGGFEGRYNLNTVEKYIPEENKWMQMPTMQQSRNDVAAAVCDGKIYASGGYNHGILNIVECFDPKINIWTMFVNLPSPLEGHSMISDGTSLIVLGGYDGQEVYNTVWKINTKQENPAWKTMTAMMKNHRYFSAILLENRIYAIGGHDNKTVEIFNGKSWEVGPETLEYHHPVSVVIPSHLGNALLSL